MPKTAAKAAAARVQKAPPVKVAPADEYFGKLKMSVLGIRNTIKDVGANIEIDQTRWAQQASKAMFAEDAMRDWERKYPKDTWLAKTVFALERMYAKLDSDEGRKRSMATMLWLVHDFPTSWYGKTGKRELALGRVGHPAVAAASPAPSASPEEIAAPAGLASSAPATSAASAATTAGVPAQTAGATPAPLPSASPGVEH